MARENKSDGIKFAKRFSSVRLSRTFGARHSWITRTSIASDRWWVAHENFVVIKKGGKIYKKTLR